MSACDIVYGLYSTHILRQYLHIPKKNRRNRIPASIFEGRNNTPFLRVYEQQVCSFFLIIFPSCVSKAVLFMEFWQHDQISFRVFEIRRSLIFFHFSRVVFFLTDLLKQDIHTILSIDISNDIEIFFFIVRMISNSCTFLEI